MDHTNEQVLLLGVRKELHIPLSTVMADHCKARCLIRLPDIRFHIHKAPIHLIGLSGVSGIAASSVSLRRHDLTLGRNEILMFLDIDPNLCYPASVPDFLYPFFDGLSVCNVLPQKIINDAGKAGQDCCLLLPPSISMGQKLESVCFQLS